MKTLTTALLAAAATAAMSGAAFAQDESPLDLSFNVGAATDYVWRGVSQTDESPQIYGGVDATVGMVYAGTWLSNVDFGTGNDTDFELDLYAGIRPQLGPVALDLGIQYYGYINAPTGSDQDFVEFKLAGSVPVGPATVGAAVYWSDDFAGTGNATYVELNGSVPVAEKVSISGAVGRQDVDYSGDYSTWNLGVSYALNDIVGFDLRYHDTDKHKFGDLYDSRVVLSLKASF